MNPHWPYHLTDTVNFTYNGKNVIGTILKFGDGYFTMITKNGRQNYYWDKMKVINLYQCAVRELIRLYEVFGQKEYKYLADYYGRKL